MELEARDDSAYEDSFRQIGAELNAARLERGLQINEIAHLLRISKIYLKNLEAGEFDELPGPTYVSGYLRTYAREIGLDPDEITKRYRALLGAGEDRPHYSFPVDKQRPQRSGAMMASLVVIFAVAGYGGWYALGKPDVISSIMQDNQPETVAAPQVETAVTEPDDLGGDDAEPVDLVETVPTVVEEPAIASVPQPSAEPDVTQTLPAIAAEIVDNGMEPTPALPENAAADIAGLGSEAASVAAPEVSPQAERALAVETPVMPSMEDSAGAQAEPGPQTPASSDMAALPSAESEIRADPELATAAGATIDSASAAGVAFARERAPDMEITLRATGVSWVEIIRNDGEEVMTRLMRAGETYLVDSRDRLYLSTGNAGGLELVFDDGTVRPIGESGEILRDLLLDAVKLRNQL